MNVKIISAGAGSGKTYRLTSELVSFLKSGEVRPSGVIATTFTNKAAAELHERVRTRLIEEGLSDKANELGHAMIGTVHSLGVKLLSRFALEAGISPEVDIIAEEDRQLFFSQSMATVMTHERVSSIEKLAGRLSLSAAENNYTDWRKMLRDITDLSRANDFSIDTLELSKNKSIGEFKKFLHPAEGDEQYVNLSADAWNARLKELMGQTIGRLEQNEDSTKKTQSVVDDLQKLLIKLERGAPLSWAEWAKISKLSVGAKSRTDVEELLAFAKAHYLHPEFQQDLNAFIAEIFDMAGAALTEYASFKKQRGLIDYTDMEVLVRHLLDRPDVQAILSKELDLLMVDEFQDTNPLQLDIFLKLSRLARQSVWVGDPKQSIYGFRGAEPALIQAIIEDQGGLDPENIQPFSWRSREDLVNFSNAVFTSAFNHIPEGQVALEAKRRATDEPAEAGAPVRIWELSPADPSARLRTEWMHNSIASAIASLVQAPPIVLPKGEKKWRKAVAGDVAVLCRSNDACRQIAGALHRSGLKASVARAGLLETAEARLVMASLRLILNRYDSLAKAELWYFTSDHNLEQIIQDRLDYLEAMENGASEAGWGSEVGVIAHINRLRQTVGELSASELIRLLLDELDLRRIIIRWGNADQRLSNVEQIVKNALDYEDACIRRNAAASLGGFLLWLNEMARNDIDEQGTADTPDAVKVVTYHRSKGLEYPIVVCNNLWQSLRADLWGAGIVRQSGTIDLSNPLSGRWLRLWVNPYARQYQRTVLAERLSNSEEQKLETERALAEEKRLLYVGFTRARDYLVLPTAAKYPPQWFDRVMGLPDGMSSVVQLFQSGEVQWAGKPVVVETRQLEFDLEAGSAGRARREAVHYFDSPAGRSDHQDYFIDFSEWRSEYQVVESEEYAAAFSEVEEEAAFALLQLFRSSRLHYSDAELMELMEDQMRVSPSLRGLLPKAGLLQRLKNCQQLLRNKLGGNPEYLKPLSGELQDKKYHLELDIVAVEKGKLWIVQHCTLPPNGKARERVLKLETAKLHISKLAASSFYSVSSCLCFLHSPLSGQLIGIDFQDHSSS